MQTIVERNERQTGTAVPADTGWKSFRWLNRAQLLGALNDNLFKLLAVFCLVGRAGADSAGRVLAVAGALFVVPFLTLTPTAGYLADRWSKSRLLVGAKLLEVVVMAAGTIGFVSGNPWWIYGAVFAMAVQSALFGPAKFGIVPELVSSERLAMANGRLVAASFLAVIAGTALAPGLAAAPAAMGGIVCVAIAVAGWAAATRIARTAPANGARRYDPLVVRSTWRTLRSIRGDRPLVRAIAGTAAFSFVGAFLQLSLLPYGIEVLGWSERGAGVLFLFAAIGIGLGALAAGGAHRRSIEIGAVPIGAFGMLAGVASLAIGPAAAWWSIPAVVVTGASAGLFVVPLQAFLQHRTEPARRGAVVAAAGVVGWLGVLAASGALYLVDALGAGIRVGLAAAAAAVAAIAFASTRNMTAPVARFVLLTLARAAYRVRSTGGERIPSTGGALLIANHVSYADAIVLMSVAPRPIRFLIGRPMYENRLVRPFADASRAIPISATDSPRRIARALRDARAALDAGDLVCIFPEGALTRTGRLASFHPGFERIVRGSEHPVIPVHIEGLWASVFSHREGAPMTTFPRRIGLPVTVRVGRALNGPLTPASARDAVQELGADAFADQVRRRAATLPRQLVRATRKAWNERATWDAATGEWTRGRFLAAAVLFARRLRPTAARGRAVGVLLPPSAAAGAVNVALSMTGRIPVNLNYTASDAALRSAIRQADIRTVISSRRFLDRWGRTPPSCAMVILEDLLDGVSRRDRAGAWLAARFAPSALLLREADRDLDATATVIFSSGSTGEPKGIELSHLNIAANVRSILQVLPRAGDDNVCGVLPFFHSFGFSCTLWMPLLGGLSVAWTPNPLDADAVAHATSRNRSTLLVAPPTFLRTYARRIDPDAFASLRFVAAGAERLRPSVADEFEQRFGLRPLEGYGATELSPVATLNLPPVPGTDKRVGPDHREGTAGRPIPGVEVRVIDIDTGEPLPAGSEGMLVVRGANVMKGYLGRPDLTDDAVHDGWYRTGDLGQIDEDGFVTITDRLSRFSKIGGEMVPHGGVEEALRDIAGVGDEALAVTTVADDARGERLVVVFTDAVVDLDRVLRGVRAAQMPNLWKPGRDAWVRVAALPRLGSGKLDLHGLAMIARQALSQPAAA